MANFTTTVWNAAQYLLSERMQMPEYKYAPSPALMTFLRNTDFLVTPGQQQSAYNQKNSDTQAVTVNTINQQATTTMSARAAAHTGSNGDSTATTLTYTTYGTKFKYSVKQSDRQVFGMAEMLMRQIRSAGIAVNGLIETALMASIEGERGTPRPRPPFPAEAGLWGKPTNINNVKTFANIPVIVTHDLRWFASRGMESSKGTAIFSLVGKVNNTGLIEVPMGMTLRKIIYDIGGGIPGGKAFKAVQTGGPSGGCLPASLLDMPIDFDSLTAAGSIMGSGGMVVMDEDTCMVDVAHYFIGFTQGEFCGHCLPCRLGTKQMFDILDDITQGRGKPEDIDVLLELSEMVVCTSLCGLGKTAPNPVLTTLRYFYDEYEAHINQKRCPAGVCLALVKAGLTDG